MEENIRDKRNRELIKEYQETNSNKILEYLIFNNYGYIKKISSQYIKLCNSLDIEDLMLVGQLGLIEAVQRFDLNYENTFLTYAAYYIQQKIMRAIDKEDSFIRLPVHQMSLLRRFYRLYDTGISFKECCIKLNVNEKEMIHLINMGFHPHTLDDIIKEVQDDEQINSLYNLIEDKKNNPILEQVIINDTKREIRYILENSLNEKERDVIYRRFGFFGERQTLDEIGKCYNITRERIRQIEAKAIRKLRPILIKNHINQDIFEEIEVLSR